VPRYRFWSDTNQRGFEHDLFDAGIEFRTERFDVIVDSDESLVEELASLWGSTRMKDDAGTGTSGLVGSGLNDIGAVSARAHAVPDDGTVPKRGLRAARGRDASSKRRRSLTPIADRHAERRKALKANR